jgi:eIF-2B alpha/beta/delta-like uncharacterized protein
MNISPEILNLIDDIKHDKTQGASQLARRAISVLKAAAECSQANNAVDFLREQRAIGEKLMAARPTMAPIYNMVTRLLAAAGKEGGGKGLEAIRRFTISRADDIVRDSLEAITRIVRHGCELISAGDRILTHSYSSTVIAVLKEAVSKYGSIEVVVTRSGAGRTGEQIAAELGNCGAGVTLIDDTAAGIFLPAVDKVMLGADRVCADGKVINGVGSYQLALLSKEAGSACYVLCDTFKFDLRVSSDQVDLEDREPGELVEPGRLPPGVRVKNPHFDITPLELIAGVVTERGLLAASEVNGFMAELKSA